MTTKMQKNSWHLGAALSLAAVVSLTAPAAHAAVSLPEPAVSTAIVATAVDAGAVPLGQAMPSFVFDFTSDFDLFGFEVTIAFDPSKLSFNAAASTLTAGGNTMTLPNTLMAMQLASPDFIHSPDVASFGTAINTGSFSFDGVYLANSVLIPAGSTVTMTGVFNLLPGFATGSTQCRYSARPRVPICPKPCSTLPPTSPPSRNPRPG